MLVTERCRPPANHPQRRAGSPAGRRRADCIRCRGVGVAWRRSRVHGRRASSAVRARTDSSISPTPSRSTTSAGRSRSHAAKWDGKALTEVQGHLRGDDGTGTATRLAFGRDGTLFMTTTECCTRGAEQPSGSQQPGRQGSAAARRRWRPERQPVRRKAWRTSQRCTRSAPQLARSGRSSGHRRDVAERKWSERRRRNQHPRSRAATTAGRW